MVNIALLRKSPVHKWWSTVVKSVEHNSPVVKWETPYSPVHMNAALALGQKGSDKMWFTITTKNPQRNPTHFGETYYCNYLPVTRSNHYVWI